MTNRLPEKLTLLRKHYGYSQGDLAERLGIPVTEYMNWENGNAIPYISQLKELCDLFHVSVDVMIDNTKEVDISADFLSGSAQIPFMNGQSINATQRLSDPGAYSDMQRTAQLDTVDPGSEEASGGDGLGSTRRMDTLDTGQFDTVQNDEEEEEKPLKKQPSNKSSGRKNKQRKELSSQKKKQLYIITACAAAAAALVIIIITVLNHRGSSLSVGSVNRLAEGDEYTLYIDSNGSLKTYGNFNDSDFDGSVQVSAYGSHAAGLKKDGTVVTNDDENVSDWSKITMIAAGSDHTVGLQADGSVICTGNVDACEVTDWTNIKAVYAGNGITAGVTDDNTLRVSGGSTNLDGMSNVAAVAFSDDLAAVLDTSGMVQAYSLTGSAAVDTSTLSDIEAISAGSGYVLGLNNKGRIITAGLSSDDTAASYTDADDASDDTVSIKDKVEGWSNIRYLASYNGTIVAFDKSGEMHGAGDNTYNQYVDTGSNAEETDEPDKLATPQNPQVAETTTNIVLKWDAVENADYYTVTMNGDDLGQFSTNSASVPASSMEEGSGYIFRIIAHSNDPDKFKDSDAAQYSYTFTKKTTQLGTPDGVSASVVNGDWLIKWNAVDNATSYTISMGDGDPYTSNTNQLTIPSRNLLDGTTYTITVTAVSSSSAFTDSEPSTVELTYTAARMSVAFTFVDSNDEPIGSQASLQMTPGTHTVKEAVNAGLSVPAGYTIADDSQSFTVSANTANAVTIRLNESAS